MEGFDFFAQVKDRLARIMQRIHTDSVGKEADFDCMPENMDSIDPHSSAADLGGGTPTTPLLGMYNARRFAFYSACNL